MNTLLRCCIAAGAVATLAACAHSDTMRHQSAAVAPGSTTYQQDSEYIQIVETKARHRGVEVHWVNPSVKRLVASASDSQD